MSEEKVAGVLDGWRAALEARDVEKALSFVAEDAVWNTNEGIFKGKQELKRYFENELILNKEGLKCFSCV